MIIVDTGIWIDHLRAPNAALAVLGEYLEALLHPCVLGEIALGSLRERSRFLGRLATLPQPPVARHVHVMRLIEAKRLYSTGVGYVDAHLIASALLLPGGKVWTNDKRLRAQVERLGVAYAP